MKIAELRNYGLPAGRVTTWMADAEASELVVDERPFSPQQLSHAAGYRPDAPTSWIGAALNLPYRFNADAFAATLRIWQSRHEAFRSTATLYEGELARVTVPASALQIVQSPPSELMSGHEVTESILDFFGRVLSPVTWPPMAIATVIPEDDPEQFYVIFGADHGALDAYSLVIAVHEIDEYYRGYFDDEVQLREDGPSYPDFSMRESQRGVLLPDDYATIGRWAYLLGAERTFPTFVSNADQPHVEGPWGPPQHTYANEVLTSQECDRIHAYARERGHGMAATVVACLAAAVPPRDFLDFVMPMHTRTPDLLHAMGWYVGIAPVHIDLTSFTQEDLLHTVDNADLMAAIEGSMAHVRTDAEVPFALIGHHLGVSTGPKFVMSYLDLRFVPGAEIFADRQLMALRSEDFSEDEVYLWLVRVQTGMVLSARVPRDNPMHDESMALLARLEELLKVQVARCD